MTPDGRIQNKLSSNREVFQQYLPVEDEKGDSQQQNSSNVPLQKKTSQISEQKSNWSRNISISSGESKSAGSHQSLQPPSHLAQPGQKQTGFLNFNSDMNVIKRRQTKHEIPQSRIMNEASFDSRNNTLQNITSNRAKLNQPGSSQFKLRSDMNILHQNKQYQSGDSCTGSQHGQPTLPPHNKRPNQQPIVRDTNKQILNDFNQQMRKELKDPIIMESKNKNKEALRKQRKAHDVGKTEHEAKVAEQQEQIESLQEKMAVYFAQLKDMKFLMEQMKLQQERGTMSPVAGGQGVSGQELKQTNQFLNKLEFQVEQQNEMMKAQLSEQKMLINNLRSDFEVVPRLQAMLREQALNNSRLQQEVKSFKEDFMNLSNKVNFFVAQTFPTFESKYLEDQAKQDIEINQLEQNMLKFVTKDYIAAEIMQIKLDLDDLFKKAEEERLVSKLDYKKDQRLLSQELDKMNADINDIYKLARRHDELLDQAQEKLHVCLTEKDRDKFNERIGLLPSREQFEETVKSQKQQMDKYMDRVEDCHLVCEQNKSIILRYDEIICSKLNSWQLSEFKEEILGKFKETFAIADNSRKFNIRADKQLQTIEDLQQNHQEVMDKMLERQKELLTHQHQINEIRAIVESVHIKVQSKLNIDEFDQKQSFKADQQNMSELQSRLEFLEYQYKQCIVVLHETLGLHQPKPDDTDQTKLNRVTLLINQMGSLVNSVSQSQSQDWAKINPLESITGLEVPFSRQTHNKLPISPAVKSKILQSHALLMQPETKKMQRRQSTKPQSKVILNQCVTSSNILKGSPKNGHVRAVSVLATPKDYSSTLQVHGHKEGYEKLQQSTQLQAKYDDIRQKMCKTPFLVRRPTVL